MRRTLPFLSLLLLLTSCQVEVKKPQEPSIYVRDLKEIKEQGVLKAIMVYGTGYFLYRGEPLGYEYELLRRFADDKGLKLEIVITKNIEELIDMLNRGEGDLVAYGLTVTQERQVMANFSDYIYLTKQKLVQRKPSNWRKMKLHEIEQQLISDPIELIGDTVSVRVNTSYMQRLGNLQREMGGQIYIDTLPGSLPTEKIIQMVADGEIKYTVSDDNLANISAAYIPILDVKTPISFSQRVAWALRKNSPRLLDTLNNWIKKMRKRTDYYVIYNKYFKNRRVFNDGEDRDFFALQPGNISPYDSIIKVYSKDLGWDWRLVSAVVYRESRFQYNHVSWAGARGLMQLMPKTAEELGVVDIHDPEDNIRIGTKYMKKLWEQWQHIPDSTQRVKFSLASYNCGYYHVRDAQRLAEKYGQDAQKWEDNVALHVKNLSYPEYYNDPVVYYGYIRGSEPITYVSDIMELYQRYRELVPNEKHSLATVMD